MGITKKKAELSIRRWTLRVCLCLGCCEQCYSTRGVAGLLQIVILFHSDKYPEAGLSGHIIVLFSIFWGCSLLFPTVLAPFYIPTNTAQGSLFSTSPTLVTSVIAILTDVVALLCISLTVSDVEHLFIYLLTIWIFSLGKCLLRSFVHF